MPAQQPNHRKTDANVEQVINGGEKSAEKKREQDQLHEIGGEGDGERQGKFGPRPGSALLTARGARRNHLSLYMNGPLRALRASGFLSRQGRAAPRAGAHASIVSGDVPRAPAHLLPAAANGTLETIW